MKDPVSDACVACESHLVAVAYGETADVPAECVAHLQGCKHCAAELAAMKHTRSIATLPLESPSEALDLRILAAFDAHQTPTATFASRHRRWRASLAAAAGLSAVAVATVFVASEARHGRDGVSRTASSVVSQESALEEEVPSVSPPPTLLPFAAEREEAEVRPTKNQARTEQPKAPAKKRKDDAEEPIFEDVEPIPAEKPLSRPKPEATRRAAKDESSPRVLEPSRLPAAVGLGAASARQMAFRAGGMASQEEAEALDDAFEPEQAADEVRRADSELDAAQEAAERGNHERAAKLFARLADSAALSPSEAERALVGQARALLALKRLDEAMQVAHRLPAESAVRNRLVTDIVAATKTRDIPEALPANSLLE